MRTISTWTVRPKYVKVRKKKKIVYINGLIICKDETTAVKLAAEYQAKDIEAIHQFEELQVRDSSDDDMPA